MTDVDLSHVRRVHFVGVGGAGMSAIAKVLLERGLEVTGSDLKRSRASTMLEAMGARLQIGHDPAFVETVAPDVVVASSAIPDSNPEMRYAQANGIPITTRGEALAWVLRGSRSIVVAGTHGKTTTTSMIVSILRASGRDPTYLVGAGLNDVGTNARSGRDPLSVAESDESDGSFLLLSPHVAVVTNVEVDHLDFWDSGDDLRRAFARFIAQVDRDGSVVVPANDADLVIAARSSGRNTVTFGHGGDLVARDVSTLSAGTSFEIGYGEDAHRVDLQVPGMHNVYNALAAAGGCLVAGLDVAAIARGLGTYRGVERRFQVRGEANGVTVVDDYAHHPTEVRATLAAARPGPWRRVVAVFQPHRYSRTRAFQEEFGASFGDADRIVVTDVYGAGESPVPGVSGKLVADAVCAHVPGRPVAYLPHRSELLSYVANAARPGDVVLTLGAGDISAVGEELLARLEGTR